MPPRPGPLAAVLLALLVGLAAGCTASDEPDPVPPTAPPSGDAANADPAADLCARIDYTLAAPAFGEPLEVGPEDDGIGSRHSCVQRYRGTGASGAGAGMVEVRTVAYGTAEAARTTFDAAATAGTPAPLPDGLALGADAARYRQTDQLTSIELLHGRLTVEVEFTPAEELGMKSARLPAAAVAFAAHVLELLPET